MIWKTLNTEEPTKTIQTTIISSTIKDNRHNNNSNRIVTAPKATIATLIRDNIINDFERELASKEIKKHI